MSISEKLKEVLSNEGQKFAADEDFTKLQAFYSDMQRKGLVLKQQYSLPQLDTIGHTIYHRVKSV